MVNLSLIGQQVIEPVWEYPYQIFGAKDGLSQSQVREVYQDSRGFVWVATKESLERFDGLEFVNFRNDSTFIQDHIGKIYEDYLGNVWFSGRHALYRYNENGFRTFKFDAIFHGASIINMNGRVGVKMKGDNQDYYEVVGDTLLQVEFNDSLTNPKRYFHYLHQPFASDTFFVVSNMNRRDGWHEKSRRLSLLIRDSLIFDLPLRINPVAPLYNKNKKIYFESEDIVFQYLNNELVKDFVLPTKSVGFVAQGIKGFQLGNGLYVQKDSLHYHQFFSYPFKPAISSDTEDGIYVDSEKGFVKVFIDHAFENYPTNKGMTSGVWSIVEDDDGLMWFSSMNNSELIQMNSNHSAYFKKSYRDLKNRLEYVFYPGAIKTRLGELWFPTAKSIILVDKKRNITEIKTPVYNFLLEEKEGILTVGKTLDIYQNKKIIKSYSDIDGLNMSSLGFIETIAKDTSNQFWLGAHLGLATWDGEETFKNYFVPEDIHSGIMAIKKDYRNNLWFGTHNGLLLYDYTDSLPRAVGLEKFDKAVKSIEFIDSSYMIMGGSGVIYLLDLQKFYHGEFDLYTFTKEDGFIGEECLQNSIFKDSDKNIWIGTSDGVVKIYPKKLKQYKTPTEPHFSYFSYKEKGQGKETSRSIPVGENNYSVTANSDDKNFEFRFFTINHHKPKSITYRHRLNKNGKKENWSLPRSPRFVSYNNLPYGDYEFEIQTCLYGKFSEPKSIFLKVKAVSFLELLWVKIAIGLTILGLGLLGIFKNRIAKRREEKTELQQLKTQKNLAVHKITPHFTSNALTAISSLIQKNENDNARNYIAKFANLYRPLTTNEGKLFRTLGNEIEFIENYIALEKLRFNFEYSSTIAPNVDLNMNVPAMVIQSFVSNAVKHGMELLDEGGWIKMNLTQADNTLIVMISDNGLGRLIAQEKAGKFNTGKGISIAKDIFHFLNETIEGKSELVTIEDLQRESPVGTKVILNIFTNYPNEI